jgi:hypothetical protein
MPEIDAVALCRIAGLSHLQLNTWVNRGLVPGASDSDQRGKRRSYDLETTLFICTAAQLTAIGIDLSFASTCAKACARIEGVYERAGSKLMIGPRTTSGPVGSRTIDIVDAGSLEILDRYLDHFTDGRPLAFMVIELDRLGEQVRKVFEAEAAAREMGFTSAFRREDRK